MPAAFQTLFLPFLAVQASVPPPVQQPPVVVTAHGGVPFISPMGEPIRARVPNEDTLARWFNQVDRNSDGLITRDEMVGDAERYFAILDTDHDGQIDPDELIHYEWTVAPEIQVSSRLRQARTPGSPLPRGDVKDSGDEPHGRRERDNLDSGPQGAARYALLNMPEPVAAADADFNRAITLQEFKQAALDRFALLDKARQGRLTLQQLEALKPVLTGKRPKHRDDEADTRVGSPLPPGY